MLEYHITFLKKEYSKLFTKRNKYVFLRLRIKSVLDSQLMFMWPRNSSLFLKWNTLSKPIKNLTKRVDFDFSLDTDRKDFHFCGNTKKTHDIILIILSYEIIEEWWTKEANVNWLVKREVFLDELWAVVAFWGVLGRHGSGCRQAEHRGCQISLVEKRPTGLLVMVKTRNIDWSLEYPKHSILCILKFSLFSSKYCFSQDSEDE